VGNDQLLKLQLLKKTGQHQNDNWSTHFEHLPELLTTGGQKKDVSFKKKMGVHIPQLG
jgi:hypothetical protein